MFRADSDADEARRDRPKHWKPLQQAHRERHLHFSVMLEGDNRHAGTRQEPAHAQPSLLRHRLCS